MKLPLCEQAEILMDKLICYCLNPNHPTGKHKARVFASVLGITTENVQDLLTLILKILDPKFTLRENTEEEESKEHLYYVKV